ncbi:MULTISPECIES: ABC transporter ATP-binding protein [unclassified Paenibacillus]|uniref:ABC transporter ATP-binding protein n=1 Tax=unclassified Paenibacillus TaxID=185978 RepID=UPI0004F5A029|nr:ATP-binding cassette domain-containing protein [Paenibacillus sp. FSL R5-0345]AIQ35225.1 ABC transporter [Paenibacillus sp. FSL R5-0345]
MGRIFEIQGIAKLNWKSSEQASKYLFSDISAEITESDRIALIGASGQGKSTLLRIMALLDAPDEGDMLVNGTSFKSMDSRLWRMKVGFVAQQAVMLPGSMEDNLRTVSKLHDRPYDLKLVQRLLEQLGLDQLDLSKKAADCSGGEKQRISLIRSLLLRPNVLLLDEITASLDIDSTQRVEDLLVQWHKEEGTSMIWVTHDLKQASRISTTTWFMGNGKLEQHLSESFFAESAEALAKRFIRPLEGASLL